MSDRKTVQTPLKVYESTRDQLRVLSVVLDKKQAEIVEIALAEYVSRHSELLHDGLARASASIFASPAATEAGFPDFDERQAVRDHLRRNRKTMESMASHRPA